MNIRKDFSVLCQFLSAGKQFQIQHKHFLCKLIVLNLQYNVVATYFALTSHHSANSLFFMSFFLGNKLAKSATTMKKITVKLTELRDIKLNFAKLYKTEPNIDLWCNI